MQKTETERKADREKERRVFLQFFCSRAHENTKKSSYSEKKPLQKHYSRVCLLEERRISRVVEAERSPYKEEGALRGMRP